MRSFALLVVFGSLVCAQTIPQWEDFRAATDWSGPNARIKLSTPEERSVRRQVLRIKKEAPNFAGHYRFVGWGCGSGCAAGAFVDLQTGKIYPPPRADDAQAERWIFSGGVIDAPYIEMRSDSRLIVIRGRRKDQAQELRYYEWSGSDFRLITRVADKPAGPGSQRP